MPNLPRIERRSRRRISRRAAGRLSAAALALIVLPTTAGTARDRAAGPRQRFAAPPGPRQERNALGPAGGRPR